MLNLVCMGFSMIDQELIYRIKSELDEDWEVKTELVCSLLDNYINLIEQNAEMHKELAKFKAQSFEFNNGFQCSNIPNDLEM
jgi:hypothetical protein